MPHRKTTNLRACKYVQNKPALRCKLMFGHRAKPLMSSCPRLLSRVVPITTPLLESVKTTTPLSPPGPLAESRLCHWTPPPSAPHPHFTPQARKQIGKCSHFADQIDHPKGKHGGMAADCAANRGPHSRRANTRAPPQILAKDTHPAGRPAQGSSLATVIGPTHRRTSARPTQRRQ